MFSIVSFYSLSSCQEIAFNWTSADVIRSVWRLFHNSNFCFVDIWYLCFTEQIEKLDYSFIHKFLTFHRFDEWTFPFGKLCIDDFCWIRICIVIEQVCNGCGWNSINRQRSDDFVGGKVGKENSGDFVRLQLRIRIDDLCTIRLFTTPWSWCFDL